jgi:hypothetical protein
VTFKKGNKGRPVGALNKLPAEAKDVLARAYTELGGFERFMQWIESEPEHLAHFYTKMWIKLLPMNIRVDSTKNVVYKSYHEVSVALADHSSPRALIVNYYEFTFDGQIMPFKKEFIDSAEVSAFA